MFVHHMISEMSRSQFVIVWSSKTRQRNTDLTVFLYAVNAPLFLHKWAGWEEAGKPDGSSDGWAERWNAKKKTDAPDEKGCVSGPFGRLGWSPWRSVGCGPAAGACRPLRKKRGLQSARCFLRRVETQAGCTKTWTCWSLNVPHLQQLCCASLTSVFAVWQDVFGYLIAPTHVVLVGLGHSELADWDQRSALR